MALGGALLRKAPSSTPRLSAISALESHQVEELIHSCSPPAGSNGIEIKKCWQQWYRISKVLAGVKSVCFAVHV